MAAYCILLHDEAYWVKGCGVVKGPGERAGLQPSLYYLMSVFPVYGPILAWIDTAYHSLYAAIIYL